MGTVIERTEGHYDVREVPYGKVYTWRSGRLVVECDCGPRLILTFLVEAACRCGADHTAVVSGELAPGRLGDRALHSWRYERDRSGAGLPY